MEQNDRLDKPIGTKESTKYRPGEYAVINVDIVDVKKKTGEPVGEKVALTIEHPDADEPIQISSVSYLKNKTVKNAALWYNEDVDGNIPKDSALASAMLHYKVTKIREFLGLKIITEVDDKGYLQLKAY